MKYLVMEVFTSYAVLLDEEGRFVKSANMQYEVGQTVFDPILMREEPLEVIEEEPKEKSKVTNLFSNRVVTILTTIAAVVALFFGMNFYQNNYVPYSSIYMAINPEVEMVLSKNGSVMDVVGTNADGVELVENYDQESKDKVEVANELVDLAIEMGFLSEGGQVSIAIDTPDRELLEQYGIELRQGVDGKIEIIINISDANDSDYGDDSELTESRPSATDDSAYYDDDSEYEETTTTSSAPATETTTSQAPAPPTDDDSEYDDAGYDTDDDSIYEETTTQATTTRSQAPAESDDSEYDDSLYDDSGDDDDDDDDGDSDDDD